MTEDSKQYRNPAEGLIKERQALPPFPLMAKAPIQAPHQDMRARGIWKRVYMRPLMETDHDFYLFLLKQILGEQWFAEIRPTHRPTTHIIGEWLIENDNLRAKILDGSGGVKSAERTGGVTELLTLARDIHDLLTTGQLPGELIRRLKNRAEFQGARYELAVAGAFARAGYVIRWTTNSGGKRCEFIAEDSDGKKYFGVEAKSRRRPGVIHELLFSTNKGLQQGVRHLLTKAKRQAPSGVPFITFIDLNLPPNDLLVASQGALIKTVQSILAPYGWNSPQDPDVCTAMIFTNFAWHYLKGVTGGDTQVILVAPKYCLFPVESARPLALIEKAINEHAIVPNIFPTEEEARGYNMSHPHRSGK